jgi:hypothetical protein
LVANENRYFADRGVAWRDAHRKEPLCPTLARDKAAASKSAIRPLPHSADLPEVLA